MKCSDFPIVRLCVLLVLLLGMLEVTNTTRQASAQNVFVRAGRAVKARIRREVALHRRHPATPPRRNALGPQPIANRSQPNVNRNAANANPNAMRGPNGVPPRQAPQPKLQAADPRAGQRELAAQKPPQRQLAANRPAPTNQPGRTSERFVEIRQREIIRNARGEVIGEKRSVEVRRVPPANNHVAREVTRPPRTAQNPAQQQQRLAGAKPTKPPSPNAKLATNRQPPNNTPAQVRDMTPPAAERPAGQQHARIPVRPLPRRSGEVQMPVAHAPPPHAVYDVVPGVRPNQQRPAVQRNQYEAIATPIGQ